MYDSQEMEKVTLLCANDVMKAVIDKFGSDITVKKADQDHFRTTVKVCLSSAFYGWVFQWEGRIRIDGPEEAVKAYRDMLQKAMKN